jgi:hypothetical protein
MHKVLTLSALLTLTACTALEVPEESTGAQEEQAATSEWSNVAPGVWERSVDGRIQRRNVGIDGLRSVLARARAERTQLAAAVEQGASGATEQAAKNQALIADLEKALAEMEKDPQRKTAVPAADPGMPGIAARACGGNYALTVQMFVLNLANFEVQATSSWSEFGPFGPGQRTLGTYTWGISGNNVRQEDADSVGPFSGSCCASVSSRSGSYVVFSPQLYGLAYVHLTNGCSHFDSVEGP